MESKDNDSLEPADTAAQGKRRHPGEDSQSFDDGGTIKKKRSQDNEVENEEADEEITSSNFVVKTEKTDEEPTSSVSDTLVKTEKSDEECSNDNIATAAVKIKSEPVDDEPASSTPTVTIKTEPAAAQVSPANSGQSATVSSSLRPSCRFGVRCYRVNPAHRAAEAHPGESDYRRPDFPAPPLGTPNCPFGNSCYRRNPVHFQQYSHPADFNSAQNIRLRQRRAQTKIVNGTAGLSDLESDEEDPFHDHDGSDDDYKPGDNVDDSEDEDELEFNSERQHCDDYD